MDIIDEKGNLFGVVNVVDALVVFLAVAVVAAGTALVVGGGDSLGENSQEPTRYATVSYTVPLESDAATLGRNDSLDAIGGEERYDVSDVYRSFAPSGDVHVVVRIAYEGHLTPNGNRLYGGQATPLSTGAYRVDANVTAINQSASTIQTRKIPVVLSANVSSSVARALEEGQEATIGNHTVATIESVDRGGTTNGNQQVWVGVELTAWERATGPVFDGEALRVDNRVTIVTDTVVVRGRLHEVGTTTPGNATRSP